MVALLVFQDVTASRIENPTKIIIHLPSRQKTYPIFTSPYVYPAHGPLSLYLTCITTLSEGTCYVGPYRRVEERCSQ